jgi:hypothetical protein
MCIALTCKIHIAWGMNSFIPPHPFINFCILLWREKVFPIHILLSLIRRKIISRVQRILVPKRQVLFLILTRRWKRTDDIFRHHKSEADFYKKIHLHQWNIANIFVLVSIKHKSIFKKVGTICRLLYLSTYLPIRLFIYRSVCMSVYGEYDGHSVASFPTPKRQSLIFIHWPTIIRLSHCHVYTSTSVSLWLSLYLSLWLYPLYSPLFVVVRLPFFVYIDTSKTVFLYEASNMWTTVNLPGAAWHQMSHWFIL